VVTTLKQRGQWMWWCFAILLALALCLPALMLGPIGLVAGILSGAFGVERALHSWRHGRRALTWIPVALATAVLVHLLTPNWCHVDLDRISHCHRAWDSDHIH
jgi:uncharacterized membrane protein YhiD involved in acid resistance